LAVKTSKKITNNRRVCVSDMGTSVDVINGGSDKKILLVCHGILSLVMLMQDKFTHKISAGKPAIIVANYRLNGPFIESSG